MTDMDERLRRLEESIYGNGREGLVTRVAVLTTEVVSMRESVEKLHRLAWWAVIGTIGGTTTATGIVRAIFS